MKLNKEIITNASAKVSARHTVEMIKAAQEHNIEDGPRIAMLATLTDAVFASELADILEVPKEGDETIEVSADDFMIASQKANDLVTSKTSNGNPMTDLGTMLELTLFGLKLRAFLFDGEEEKNETA